MNIEQLNKLKEVAEYVGMSSVTKEIDRIEQRQANKDSELIIPLVGEFSSGKTSLINALTDSKQLETATKPTTATIYEIHFGCDHCHATAINEDGTETEFADIVELKNEKLASAKVVMVYDTSNRVPSSTVFVDTPGLSSPNPKHKQTLVDFLPYADAIMLAIDVNQQVTRSLTDFISTMKLSRKPIYLVLTKCDTKSDLEVAKAKQYIKDNTQIAIEDMVSVSANNGNLDELYKLLDSIQGKKNEIIAASDNQRVKRISQQLIKRIDGLITASTDDKKLSDAIDEQEYELEKIKSGIKRLIESTESDIEDTERELTRTFEDSMQNRLNELVVRNSANFNNDAVAIINGTASLLSEQYRSSIKEILRSKAASQAKGLDDISLEELDSVNVDSLSISGFSYGLDLDSVGHEHDNTISVIAKVVAAAAAVTAVVATGGAAVAAEAGVAETTITVGTVANVADTATDVASIASNRKTRKRMEKFKDFASQTQNNMESIEKYNAEYGQKIGSKGIVESMVGFVTDKTWGKPKRLKAIRNYIDTSLSPQFKQCLRNNRAQLLNLVKTALDRAASDMIGQKQTALRQMQEESKQNKEALKQRRDKLNEYKTELVIL